jgi:hypothetical protein
MSYLHSFETRPGGSTRDLTDRPEAGTGSGLRKIREMKNPG